MKKIRCWLYDRIITNWTTSLAGILLLIGYILLHQGKIDYGNFSSYIALIPTIVLLLAKEGKSTDKCDTTKK